jgi:mannose-6-phosphate isomerase
MDVYPLKFEPIFKEKIWGGRKLESVFGKCLPPEKKIGESWELADLPEDKSLIANGPFAGQTLGTLLAKYSLPITGASNYSGPFGLLIKLLDANQDLSVQVHPDAETCRRLGKGDPKAESWYILGAEKGAVIYKGLKPGVSRTQFEAAVRTGSTADLLNKIEVSPGENYFLPAGTVHAIGAGVLLAEVQTPSDTTYRVFDWNRRDAEGRTRELHIAEALESIHFEPDERDFSVPTAGRLVDSPFFKVDQAAPAAGKTVGIDAGQMQVLMILKGLAKIGRDDLWGVDAKLGDTLLLPAAFGGKMYCKADTHYLAITL